MELASGNAQLWYGGASIRLGEQGWIIGHLFSRGRTSEHIHRIDGRKLATVLASEGRSLLSDYWGGYVAIIACADGRISVIRDPSGTIACYFRSTDGGLIVSSEINDLAEPGPGAVDMAEVVRSLSGIDAPGRRTCLTGVDELFAGECLTADETKQSVEPWWSPWQWVDPAPSIGFDTAAARLRDTALDCIGAWASCFESILLGMSGGLDSSIVACATASRTPTLHCLTMVEADAMGDERRFASTLTSALKIPLRAEFYDIDAVDVERAVLPHHPRPSAPYFIQAIAAVHRRIVQEKSVDALFSGNGGDNIFCSLRSAVPFVDRYLAEGPRAGLMTTLRDISDLTGADGMTVLRHAWDRYRRAGEPHRIHQDHAGLSAKAIGDLKLPGVPHPWLDAPDRALPGKKAHVALLMRAHRSLELYPRRSHPPHIAPLLSQPLVEHCLATPSWYWVTGGINRAVARVACKGMLPDQLLQRVSKGGPSGFTTRIFETYAQLAVERLRDGLLAKHGLIDLDWLDISWSPTQRGAERAQRILALCAAENWVRWWSDRDSMQESLFPEIGGSAATTAP